jgi:Icc-related predicted phosphoesterase
MKILYTTDLHGNDIYYDSIWRKAKELKVDMVINGADMLPKTRPINFLQKRFIGFLKDEYFPRFEKARIHYLCCQGNDDLICHDELFDEVCSQFDFVHNIAMEKIEIPDPRTQRVFEFIGFNLVADYPFELKDRCRKDKENFIFPIQNGPGRISCEDGWIELEDWFAVANQLPTIEDELKDLVRPTDMKKAVYVMHMPPAGLGLDETGGHRPESKAVYDFILKEQPLLSLHGHIHSSYKISGIWKAPLGETICVQPGQGGPSPVYVLIDTDTMEIERFE